MFYLGRLENSIARSGRDTLFYLGGLENSIDDQVEELVLPHPEVLWVDEEEKIGDAQQWE